MISSTQPEARRTLVDQAVGKFNKRLLWFLLLMYVVAFLDRANVGFAKEQLQADTGLSDAAYAFGAGIFFIGYAVVEVPSNMLMHRFGARVWMTRIMVTWGLISAAMMFAHNDITFYVLRFLLGVAEAGFFPGVVLFITYWVPARLRGRTMGLFYFGAPLAFIFGSPLSGQLLELDGLASLHGWQWMFLVEGLLAVVVGCVAWFYLTDRPADANWLGSTEREALIAEVAEEDQVKGDHSGRSILSGLAKPKILFLALIYFLIQCSVYGVTFYMPTQIAAITGTKVGLMVGLITAIPWTFALIASYVIGRLSDATGQRRLIAAATLGVGGIAIAVSAAVSSPVLALVALCFGAAGFIAVQPVFWTLPTGYLAGGAAAAGIGLVNSLGSLGGFVAPNVKNLADKGFSSDQAGLYVLAGLTLLGAVCLLAVRKNMMIKGEN